MRLKAPTRPTQTAYAFIINILEIRSKNE